MLIDSVLDLKMGLTEIMDRLSVNLTCDRYWENKTTMLQKHSRFEGIPENLLLNFVAWIVSDLLCFIN